MYHRKHKYDLVIMLAVVGLSVSLFLAISSALKVAVPCDITQGCEVVLNSRYSEIAGLPLSYIGVGFFAVVIACALMANHYAEARKLLTWLLGVGALMSLGFLSLQFFIIGSVCQYCLVVDILTIALFLWDLNIEHKASASLV
jgi:uncharacterized membrane protein